MVQELTGILDKDDGTNIEATRAAIKKMKDDDRLIDVYSDLEHILSKCL